MDGIRAVIVGVVSAGLVALGGPPPAQAGMVGTEQMLAADARAAQLADASRFLARADVQQQLEAWGVAPEAAAERVAALSDAELQRLQATIGSEPAGGNALAVIGIVFVVLLILELVGVTNVFSRI